MTDATSRCGVQTAGVGSACPKGTRGARRAIDLTVAGLALLVLLPALAAIAVAIRLDSGGPALFRQTRVGEGQRPFTFFKFRTMHPGCDDHAHRELIAAELRGEDMCVEGSSKVHDDPRVTRVGGWLRAWSLDEIPQLFNVVTGEMTLVGPRPCLDWEAEMFPAEYAERYSVPPGLTGLWQVSGRSMVGTLDMLRLDVEYVRKRRFSGDLRIMIATVPAVLRGDGAR